MDKSSFLIYKSWGTLIENLDDATAGVLVKAIFAYQRGEDVSIDDPVLSAVFQVMANEFDENDAKYQAKCEKRREAANKRWNASEDTSMQKDANASKCIQKDADFEPVLELDLKKEKTANAVKEKEPKHHHGQYVLLTDKEYEKLKADFGETETEKAIEYFNVYIDDKGYKCKSHYSAMRRWVYTAVKEQAQREKRLEEQEKKEKARSGTKVNKFNGFEQRDNNMSDIEARMMRRVAT